GFFVRRRATLAVAVHETSAVGERDRLAPRILGREPLATGLRLPGGPAVLAFHRRIDGRPAPCLGNDRDEDLARRPHQACKRAPVRMKAAAALSRPVNAAM